MDNLKLIPLNKLENKYLQNNIKKYYNNYNNNNNSRIKIKYLIFEENGYKTNKLIIDNIDKNYDLIIFTNNQNKIQKNINLIPVYPIYYKENNNIFLIFTPILLQQINGFSNNTLKQNLLNDILYRINKELGGILVNTNLPNIEKVEIKDGYNNLLYDKNNILSNYFVNEIKEKYTKYIPTNFHGWLAPGTKANLEYVIHQFNPKVILELGAWLGKSDYFIKNLNNNIELYSVDKFQNVLTTPYNSNEYNPIDKFYFNVIRYETFCKNLSKYSKNLYTIKYNIDNIIDLLKKFPSFHIDIIFIDAIKNKNKLIKFINNIFKLYPNIIIVGDDYVFDSVKDAIKTFQNDYFIEYNNTSYVISKQKLINYNQVKIKNELNKKKNIYIQNISLNKDFMNYNNLNIEDKYLVLFYLITKKKYDSLLNFIYIYPKIDLNKPIQKIPSYNSIYHLLAINIRNNDLNAKNTFDILSKIQKPLLINNILHLTYKDYLDYDIEFS